MTRSLFSVALTALAAFSLVGCGNSGGESASTSSGTTAGTTGSNAASTDAPSLPVKGPDEKLKLAFVTNNASDFWTFARRGTEKAAQELKNVEVEFKIPDDSSAAGQKRIVDDLLSTNIDGVAISPNNATDQTPDIDAWSEKTLMVTQDSDAPDSKRAMYIGTDNVAAGEQAAEEIKKAVPNGGKVAVFVGKMDVQNAKERFEGIKKALEGSNITVLDPLTDDADRVRAQANVSETLTKTPDVVCLVGLWSYNGPAILNAVKAAGKQGKVKIVCFDEEADTLQGIKDGFIDATIVQQPFEFGYEAIKAMAAIRRGDNSVIPTDKKKIIPTKAITKATVAEFEKTVAQLRGS